MKAILEFDVPKSCVVCPVGHGNPCGKGQYCKATKQVFEEAYSKQTERAPFCPLKIVTNDYRELLSIMREVNDDTKRD